MSFQQITFINNSISKNRAAILDSLGYTPENVANKVTDLNGTSDILYPTQNAVKTELDILEASIELKQNILNYDTEIGAFIIPGDEYES